MPRIIFLYGDQHDNFVETSRPFIDAAGGASARIAVLTAGGDKAWPYIDRITAPWREWGVEVSPIGPTVYGGEPSAGMADALKGCTGIYVCGGDTRQYERLYVHSHLGDIIREMHLSGVPYAGVSAGALMVTERCATWGGIVTIPTNEYYVRYRGCYDGAEGDINLQVGGGLGLLKDCVVEPHFSEMGGFPRLLTMMEWTGAQHGYGLDEPICLAIENDTPRRIIGRGRFYHIERQSSRRFSVAAYDPGDELHMQPAGA